MKEYSDGEQALSTGEPKAGNPAEDGRGARGNATVLGAGLIHEESTHSTVSNYWKEYLQNKYQRYPEELDMSQERDGFVKYIAMTIKRAPLPDLDKIATRLRVGGAEAQTISEIVSPDPEVLQEFIRLIESQREKLLVSIFKDLSDAIVQAPNEAAIQSCLEKASREPLTNDQMEKIGRYAQDRQRQLEESSEPEGGVYTKAVLLAHVAGANSSERLKRIEALAAGAYEKNALTPNDFGTVISAVQAKQGKLEEEGWRDLAEYIVKVRIDEMRQAQDTKRLSMLMENARKSHRDGILGANHLKAIEEAYADRAETLSILELIRKA